ncbi:hypothetical protein GUY44_07165 [Pimelobacter simplex]|uniref:PE_PGRS family protein n=1 Tax=Nocardioides simplex TaxID=2045 RepID=A0A0A1DMB2_NOCSI|nr:hypothetical protein [Pimelobacter simplex]AIY17787.1 PE_PGRS family protein [Pimelobacter simplex]MCG8150252.1 hypothetical protein [Pimelobacter simplex]GEB13538.1 hypothetical protein NSI01_18530 [Pimelobacter simplex]SFM72014.1 hypothetical protein SAMN05421671_3133 [Pimelobacter simplex]
MGSNVRSVTVRLEAMVARYIRDMNRAGDATEKAFDRVHASTSRARESFVATERDAAHLSNRLGDLRGSTSGVQQEFVGATRAAERYATSTSKLNTTTRVVSPSQQRLATDIDRVSVAAVRGRASIDQYSGRLRVLLELLATLGPGLLPFGAGGIVGLTGLAGLFGAGAAGGLGMLVSLQGIGDALKAMEKARLEPTAANLQAADEAMQKLGPHAQDAVVKLQQFLPVLKSVRDAGAAELFPHLPGTIDSLTRMAPILRELAAAGAGASGSAIEDVAGSLNSDRWMPFWKFLVDEIPQGVENTTRLVGSLAHAGAEMWMAFDPTNDKFVDWLVDVADNLDRWAGSSKGQQQIQSFLAYAEKNGPKVADFFVAVADAITQIVQAAAPLSGPVLDALTQVAKVIAAVADSNLGTPILTGVAALTLYSRGLQAAVALQSRLTGGAASARLADQGVLGFTRSSLQQTRNGIRQLGTDLKTVGTTWATVGRGMERQNVRMNEALTRTGRTLKTVGKGGAVLGGLAIATTGVADGLGVTNTASLALMGTFAGPWGAALGAGVGAVMDLSQALDAGTSSADSFNLALASGDTQKIRDELAAVNRELNNLRDMNDLGGTGVDDFFQDLGRSTKTGLSEGLSKIGIGEGPDSGSALNERKSVLEGSLDATERAAMAEAGLSAEILRTGEAAGFTSAELLNLAVSTQQASTAAWGAFDAQTKLGAAIDGVAEAAKKGKRGLSDATEGGRENRNALSDLAASWENTKTKMEENGASAKAIQRRYGEVRGAFIAAATAMTGSRKAAVRLANQLAKPMTIVVKSEHQQAVASARAAIAQLRREIAGSPIVQQIVVNGPSGRTKATVKSDEPLGAGMIPVKKAGGGLVTGPGGPREDLIPALLSNREFVIPADAVDHYGVGLFEALRAKRLADGGRVGGGRDPRWSSAPGLRTSSSSEADGVARGLRGLRRELALAEKAVKSERKQRDAAVERRESLVSGMRSGLDRGIWRPGGSVWGENSGDPIAALRANIADVRQFSVLTGRLLKNVSGPALDAILAEGDLATVQAYAGMDPKTLKEYQRLYGVLQKELSTSTADIGDSVWGPEIRRQTRELRQANRELKGLRRDVQRSNRDNKNEQAKNRASQRKGASKANQSKSRGYVK